MTRLYLFDTPVDYKPNILMMIGIHKKSGNLDGFYQLAATGRATPTINYIYIYIILKTNKNNWILQKVNHGTICG
jgi:hypothetical protein